MILTKTYPGILIFFLFLIGSVFTVGEEKLPNDVRWVRQSEEYKFLCRQAFREARSTLFKTARVTKGSGNLAVVVDLDETVLDNSPYQVERWKSGLNFTQDSWSDWVNRKSAGLVPGAKMFLASVRKNGVRIIFLSNRMEINLEPTKRNLQALGVLTPKDLFLLRRNKADTKEIRRKEVLNGIGRMKQVGPLQVIGYVGDQMGDFPNDRSEQNEGCFLLPNPMYGKW